MVPSLNYSHKYGSRHFRVNQAYQFALKCTFFIDFREYFKPPGYPFVDAPSVAGNAIINSGILIHRQFPIRRYGCIPYRVAHRLMYRGVVEIIEERWSIGISSSGLSSFNL